MLFSNIIFHIIKEIFALLQICCHGTKNLGRDSATLQVFDAYVIILSWEKQKRCLWNEQVGTAWIIFIKEAEMSLKTFVLCQSQLIWFSGVCVNCCFMGFFGSCMC